jgi:hypothetical protein
VTARVLDFLRGPADGVLAFGARTFFNARLRGIGEMSELSIDTKKKTLRVRLDLLGEAEPIEIHVKKYALKQRGNETMLTVLDATSSREWIAETLRQLVVGRSFPIPAKAGAVLKVLT